MYLTVPMYLVALGAAFLFALINSFAPDLPITEDQVIWAIVTILTALNVDVVQALRKQGVAGIR